MIQIRPNATRHFHICSVFVILLATVSVIASNVLGTIDEYGAPPPFEARRFGWPFIFEWREVAYAVVPESEVPSTSWDHISKMPSDTRWLFAPSSYLEFHRLLFVANAAFGLILVAGCAYTVERFCRSHLESFEIRITTLLALMAWVAMVLVTETEHIDSSTLLGFAIYWLKSLRILGVGLLCYAVIDVTSRSIERRTSGNQSRST